ncbi:DUF1553 domain-containing protein [Portibacter marinus]|uniref:DUF1553 domain-containing protein n=1 Tax=Portibacter marinus TaxID=2898660 RepID=UPI001F15DB24|nr:DUF1553 domain-containing protein [Portibacter marinus]
MKSFRSTFLWYLLAMSAFSCQRSIPPEVGMHLSNLDKNISFNNEVKPILSDRCFSCHGPDANTRKAELRLDQRPPEKVFNLILDRILSEDAEILMPPPESKMELTDVEKATLVQWIKQGAKYEKHWAFIPPENEEVPEIAQGFTAYNEIDHFITQRLEDVDLKQSPKADEERLLRRVTLDLTGLPPTIQEIDAFLADDAPNAYEKVVDRLLQSEEYGERMAMEWMDVARYADSHGLHADGYRMMWPWRDWVINAFNENLSYQDFVTWQIAGDMIPNATYEQKLATAFNRNHSMTGEGGAIDEEYRLGYVYDRTETFSTVFLGLTTGCARCHDHKFDPVSQKEYYELAAFFNNVKELGMTGDDGNYGPMLAVISDEKRKEIEQLSTEIQTLSENEVYAIEEFIDLKEQEPIFHGKVNELKDGKLDQNKNFTTRSTADLVEGFEGNAALLTGEYDELNIQGIPDFQAHEPFAASLYINTTKRDSQKTQTLMGTSGNKNNFWRGWDFFLDDQNRLNARLINSLPHNYIHSRSKDSIRLNEWTKVSFTYDGTGLAKGIDFKIGDQDQSIEVVYDQLYKSIHPIKSGSHEKEDRKTIKVGKSYRGFTGEYGVFKGRVDEIKLYHFPKNDLLRNKVRAKFEVYDKVEEVMVMEEMPEPRVAYMYNRGEYNQPSEQVHASTPKILGSFPEASNRDRLGLAQLLFAPDNPLTARVTVNRYWQMIFGEGIVATPNDFGLQGARPTHPELLDYLAIQFMKHDWDMKWLMKKMVMSYTYQQSSNQTTILQEKDPENKLLARGPSFRMQAEMIRDNALAASGLLKKNKGGESVKPYQPEGLWIEKSSFSHILLRYEPDKGDSLYRRSLYTFLRRTSPNPSMTIFDAPTREVCVVKRENTSTPLQALVLLNDPQFVEISRILAERIQEEAGSSLPDQIQYAFRLATGRTADQEEINLLKELYERQYKYYIDHEQDAKDLISVGEFRVPDHLSPSKTAALTYVTSTLINHTESYMKR